MERYQPERTAINVPLQENLKLYDIFLVAYCSAYKFEEIKSISKKENQEESISKRSSHMPRKNPKQMWKIVTEVMGKIHVIKLLLMNKKVQMGKLRRKLMLQIP